MKKVLFMLVVVSLLLTGSAQAAVTTYGGATLYVGDNVNEFVPPGSSDAKSLGINCGAAARSGNKNGNDPYTTQNQDDWGDNSKVGDYNVNGVTFYADMFNNDDGPRNWNNDIANTNSDAGLFGAWDSWRYKPERGALLHGSGGGNNDGGITSFHNHITGRQGGNAVYQCGYEGPHEDGDNVGLNGDDTGDFHEVLKWAGVQNCGGYDAGTDDCERDMGFTIAVEPETDYNIKVMVGKGKNHNEDSNTRVEVDGFTILSNFQTFRDMDRTEEFAFVSYDFTSGAGQTTILVEVGRDADALYDGPGGGGWDVQAVRMILLTDITPADPVTVLNGATAIITSNVDDVVNGDPAYTLAINCGEAWFGWDVQADGWATGNWGSGERGERERTVQGVTFYADLGHDNYGGLKTSCYNYLVANEGLLWGDAGQWYWMADTADGDNPVLAGVIDMCVTGTDTTAAGGVANYEGIHNHNKLELTGTDADTFEEVLQRAGNQNCGAKGERDMTYVLEVLPEWNYNVKVIPWKYNGENTHTFVSVDDVLILDDFQVLEDLPAGNFLAVSYDLTTGVGQTELTIKVGTSDAANRRTAVQDVSAIILEDLGDPTNSRQVVDAGADQTINDEDGTYAFDLGGTVTDVELDPMSIGWTSSDPGNVTFDDPNDPNALATFTDHGVYTLTLTADDGTYRVSDSVVITISLPAIYVLNGAIAIHTNNVDDLIADVVDPAKVLAINCGEAYYGWDVEALGWETGIWGSGVNGDSEVVVQGVNFIADLAHNHYADLITSVWNYLGQPYGENQWYWLAGTDDGDLPILDTVTIGITGSDAAANGGVSAYEQIIDDNPLPGLTGTDAANFEQILQKTGRQNTGNPDERVMTYTFDVQENWNYNVKVIPYKTREEGHARVRVDDVTILDDFQPLADVDDDKFLCVSYDITTAAAATTLTVRIDTSPIPWTGEGGRPGVQDVAAVMLEDLGSVSGNTPPVVDARANQVIEFVGGVSVDYFLNGFVIDPDGDPLTITGWTPTDDPNVSYDDATDPNATATFYDVGTYTLTLTAQDAEFVVSDEVVITIVPHRVVSVENGAVAIITNNIDDIIPNNANPDNFVALNCGQGYYTDSVLTDGWETGVWGSESGNSRLTVNGVEFIADMAHTTFDDTKSIVYAAIGAIGGDEGTQWWFVAGADDCNDLAAVPQLVGVDIGVTGTDTNATLGVSAYEASNLYGDVVEMTSDDNDTDSVNNFTTILERAGAQNTGNPGERDMTYVFNARADWKYNVKIIPYKKDGAQSHTYIAVDGVTILNDFQILDDIWSDDEIAVISYEAITAVDANSLTIIIGSADTAIPLEAGWNVQTVSAIIIEDLGQKDGKVPPVVNAGLDNYTWFDGEGIAVDYQLVADVNDIDGDVTDYLWTAAGPATPDFHSNEDTISPLVTFPADLPGDYTLTLTVTGPYYTVTDEVIITVYENACTAGIGEDGILILDDGDVNEDCETNLEDLSIMAADWLEDVSFTTKPPHSLE